MASVDQHQHSSPRGYARWVAIAALVAVVAVGVALLVLSGGGGGSAPGY